MEVQNAHTHRERDWRLRHFPKCVAPLIRVAKFRTCHRILVEFVSMCFLYGAEFFGFERILERLELETRDTQVSCVCDASSTESSLRITTDKPIETTTNDVLAARHVVGIVLRVVGVFTCKAERR